MFSDVLYFVLNVLFSLFGIALIVRAWMYAIRLHPFNPYSQAVLRVTNWLVTPIRNLIKPSNRIDWPSVVACWLTALVYLLLMWLLLTGRLPSGEGMVRSLIAAVITMAKWAFNVLLWVTLIQAVLSWVNPMAPVMPLLNTLTAPLLDPIRRMLPNLGGLDLSPLVLLLVAQVAIMMLQRLSFSLLGV
ncbi:MAG TPA: YggT family protein [Burkholderiaceae bacterium]|nr:YggT family protein [Burkholderiaceae bacterium]